MFRISPITRQQLEEILAGATVIERDPKGVKVVRLNDGRFLKFFRRKHTFNRDLISPAAVRFTRHALKLQNLNIPTLNVTGIHRLVGEACTVAIYEPLPGESLRQLLAENRVDRDLMYRVGVFIARLHRLGVLFRSIHPGNIIVDGNRLGLIDLLDMHLWPWSLSRWARRRNWWHFLRTPKDRPHLAPELIDELLVGYRDAADLPNRELHSVAMRVHNLIVQPSHFR
jgi:tRNA A-37 threonylcarbamoyl transferase component Bud32